MESFLLLLRRSDQAVQAFDSDEKAPSITESRAKVEAIALSSKAIAVSSLIWRGLADGSTLT